MKAKLLILIPVIFIVAVAGVVWVAVSGWPPIIIRNREYRELLSNFKQAQLKHRVKGGDDMAGWKFQVQVPKRQTTAEVRAVGHIGVVWIQYEGESKASRLYESVDYSNAKEIRTADNLLYVHWSDGVFRSDYWLLAYDLANRREIVRRKIDPGDLWQAALSPHR